MTKRAILAADIGGIVGTNGPPISIKIVLIRPLRAKAITHDFAPASLTLLVSIVKRGTPLIASQAAYSQDF